MAVRSNVGNVVTNALQIGGVAATTASGIRRQKLGDASSAYQYLSKSEAEEIGRARASEMLQNARAYSPEEKDLISRTNAQRQVEKAKTFEAGGESPSQHLTLEEQRQLRVKQAEGLRSSLNDGEEEQTVDALMEEKNEGLDIDGEQGEVINSTVSYNSNWVKKIKSDNAKPDLFSKNKDKKE